MVMCICNESHIDWSTEGCITGDKIGKIISCECNHLSTFGILVVSLEILHNPLVYTIITYRTQILLIVALV